MSFFYLTSGRRFSINNSFCAMSTLDLTYFSPAGGNPSLDSTNWIFPKGADDCTIQGILPPQSRCAGIKVQLLVSYVRPEAGSAVVFSCIINQRDKEYASAPVRAYCSGAPSNVETILLEPYVDTNWELPGTITVTRRCTDAADSCGHEVILRAVRVIPCEAPKCGVVVEDSPAYNSWPMCHAVGQRLVCTYSRGSKHDIVEPHRGTYARVSDDLGRSWGEEHMVCNTPGYGDTPIGKGTDDQGRMLLWNRMGADNDLRHGLFRSADGIEWELISQPDLPKDVVQITDIIHVPQVGMMAFWFAGHYSGNPENSWGKLISTDNGLTWQMEVIEEKLTIDEWVTEPSAIHLGEGRILIISRTECSADSTQRGQFQITSTDYGKSWQKSRTNITDVYCSTPSLIWEKESNLLYNYYYLRGRGVLNRRVVDADYIFDHPTHWPAPETVVIGSAAPFDSGNVNATVVDGKHYLSYYSGLAPHTAILVAEVSPLAK